MGELRIQILGFYQKIKNIDTNLQLNPPANEAEIKMLQKLAKQRRESIEIFEKEGRDDLAQKEKEELTIIEQYLPEQLSPEELQKEITAIMAETGASSMKDMGRVMGIASKKLAGRADGKAISTLVKKMLNQ